jgi:hypothetical protein
MMKTSSKPPSKVMSE